MAKPASALYFLFFLLTGIVNAQVSKDVDSLVLKAIANSSQNNPTSKTKGFSYTTYEKTIITDSLQDKADTLGFFAEKLSRVHYDKKTGYKEDVQGINMAGFKKPRYEILAVTIQSRSFYDDDFVIFNNRYAGPLSQRGYKNYDYSFKGDTTILGRRGFMIGLKPKRPKTIPGLTGTLFLDAESLAIQKVNIDIDDELVVKIEREYLYNKDLDLYFPESNKLYLKKGKTSRRLSLFRGKISVGTIETNPVKKTIEGQYLVSTLYNSDFDFTTSEVIEHPALSIEIMPEAENRTPQFWDEHRPEALSERDVNSFDYLGDIVQTENIERRLAVISNFGIGYYTVNFFDFDLTYPVKFNNYEGLRLGLGGVTNERFSERFRIEGYTAYGFKDAKLKYGLGAGINLNKSHGAWLSLNYGDDLQEVGSYSYLTDRRVYSLFEPRLVNITQFFDYKTWRINQEYQVIPQVLSELQLASSQIQQTMPYRFENDGQIYDDYSTTEVTLGVRWAPSNKYMRSERGTVEIYDGFPKVTAQLTQGLKNVLGSDFNYTKLGAKFYYQVERLNKSTTQFLVEGKLAFGDLPLSHLYHTYPNAPTKETVMQRFSVAGVNSFETMYFGEFFSDRVLMGEIKHRLRPFNLGRRLKPEMVFITRYAIGDIKNPEKHLDVDFGSLKHGYTESGFEINKILFGFGTSLTYRYGAYHLPKFEDNIAFKFTFNLEL
ncbi:MAG: hypothetical protein CL868_02430 [Cytophagaceae bacterium]|nr:hypothetical protein [Cytophagaceae bacterium]